MIRTGRNSPPKYVTLPNGEKSLVPCRYDYKFCVMLKIGYGGTWFTSWSLTEAAANRTVDMWQKSTTMEVQSQIVPL